MFLNIKLLFFVGNAYICSMKEKEMYDNARVAIRNGNDPLAFLHLGSLYAQGIGTTENHALANYFYEKALAMGCQEAENYIHQEYKLGYRNIINTIKCVMGADDALPADVLGRLKKRLENERTQKNYGKLSQLRYYITTFYPDYNQEKGYDDILNNRRTVDADLCYSLCNSDNMSEYHLELVENMLQQLFAPIIQNQDLYQAIMKYGGVLQGSDEHELMQCIVNLNYSYERFCKQNDLEHQGMVEVSPQDMAPYVNAPLMPSLRRQAFKCLLSIRDVEPLIKEKFMNHLDSDEQLLNVCEEVKDEDLQLFLISFVELNIDTDSLEITYQKLLNSYRSHRLDELANHLNDFVGRLTAVKIEHQLPTFTPENLPHIELP